MPLLLLWLVPLTVLIATVSLQLLLWRRRRGPAWHHAALTPTQIPARRLAAGDVTPQEYRDLRQTLAQEAPQ